MATYQWIGPPDHTLIHPADGRPILLEPGTVVDLPDGVDASPDLWEPHTETKAATRRKESDK